jgi:hypothetical protein
VMAPCRVAPSSFVRRDAPLGEGRQALAMKLHQQRPEPSLALTSRSKGPMAFIVSVSLTCRCRTVVEWGVAETVGYGGAPVVARLFGGPTGRRDTLQNNGRDSVTQSNECI